MNITGKEIGKEAERLAEEYLKTKGYTILDRNYHYSVQGEIDIIAMKDEVVVFVEVKSRTDPNIDPEISLTKRKQMKIIRTADAYIDIHNLENYYARLDVITVTFLKSGPILKHLEDAFSKI